MAGMTRARVFLLVLLSLLPFAGAQEAPRTLTWGPMTVTVTPRPQNASNPEAQARAVVRQGARTVLAVTGWDVKAEFQPLRPGGEPELVLTAFSGGAHCCFTTYVFTRDTGPVENLGIIDGGDYGLRFADLNGDGTREIILGSNTLAYYDWSFAESPFLLTVFGWDGVRLADRTRAYPYVPAQEAARNLRELLNGLKAPPTADDPSNLKARLGGYYANMILAGQGTRAEAVLAAQVFTKSPALRDWFRQHRTGLINATYAQPEGRLQVVNSDRYPLRRPGGP
ncbi:hypothetical protein DAETH_22560 [Deinococcus aetherius]|uniref:VCBS repeat-containing protein n=1 Tax=Deinococcus aetherius TaxID=200252 RepID=A0ABN6RG05_9DEIO|nr:hypothetical protein [Deinococcus aetherius]BDP42287.1 hypothetical protein DAETH_22560 [Deinococcus aetherius]